jgi:hypothetical protein
VPNRIRFKGPPHVYEAALSLLRSPEKLERNLEKADVKLALYFIVIGVFLPREPDRCTQFLQHFEILIKASFGNAHFSGEFGR